MSGNLKRLVSQDLKRYKDHEFDLDLSYITPTLIAMGFPAEGVEGYFRNSLNDIARYLLERHSNHFLVFNLSERVYDVERMENRVLHFPWPDHHSPPLHLLIHILLRLNDWLEEDPENVAAIHCLAGRGRTGCVITAYLVFAKLLSNVSESLDFYAHRRSARLQGVSQPSQRRYAAYIDKLLKRSNRPVTSWDFRPRKLELLRIRFGPIPAISSTGGLRPLIYMYDYSEGREDTLYVSETDRERARLFPGGARTVVLDIREKIKRPVYFCGDIAFKLSHITTSLLRTKYDALVRLIFHSGMERAIQRDKKIDPDQLRRMQLAEGEFPLIFWKSDLDIAYKNDKFRNDFRVEFICREAPAPDDAIDSRWGEELYQKFIERHATIRKPGTGFESSPITPIASPSQIDNAFSALSQSPSISISASPSPTLSVPASSSPHSPSVSSAPSSPSTESSSEVPDLSDSTLPSLSSPLSSTPSPLPSDQKSADLSASPAPFSTSLRQSGLASSGSDFVIVPNYTNTDSLVCTAAEYEEIDK